MTNKEAKHIVDVAFDVPQAVRRAGEDKTYHEDEIREAKNMAIKALEELPKRRKEAKRWKRKAAQNNRSTFECGYDIGYRDGKFNEYQPDAYKDIEQLTRKEQT